MPKSRHRKNAPARQHRAMPRAVRARADAMTHHDSPPGDHNHKMTQNDSPSGDENPPMTQNDSLCHASNPEMTQNDSLCKASMTQMTQNDSHFELFSFEMTQNDSFPGQNVPQNTPSPWQTRRLRPCLCRKMTHLITNLVATPALPDAPSPQDRCPRAFCLSLRPDFEDN